MALGHLTHAEYHDPTMLSLASIELGEIGDQLSN